jgi:hypothetical protein
MSEQAAGALFTFTIDASGKVVKLESVDSNGARHELSDSEKASLVQKGTGRLEDALEAAFEAGIDCVLGDGNGEDEPLEAEETKEDAELRHTLLSPLMEHSPAKRLLRREVLNRAILGTLIEFSMESRPAAPVNAPKASGTPDRATATRAN